MSVCLHILWSSGEIKKTNKYKPGSTETCVRAKRSEGFQVMKVSYSKQKEENLGFFLSLRSMKNNWKGAIPWGKGSESGFSTCHTMAPTPVLLPGKSQGRRSLVGCSPWGHEESDTTEQLHFHFHFHFPALEKEMATHSSVLVWRIPGTGKPGGLPSMGSHRVGHNWSDLAALAAVDINSVISKMADGHWLFHAYF